MTLPIFIRVGNVYINVHTITFFESYDSAYIRKSQFTSDRPAFFYEDIGGKKEELLEGKIVTIHCIGDEDGYALRLYLSDAKSFLLKWSQLTNDKIMEV